MNAISALRQVVEALEHNASPGSRATSSWRGNHIQFQIMQRRQDARNRGPQRWVIVADARVEVTPHRVSLSGGEEVGAGANGTMVVPVVGRCSRLSLGSRGNGVMGGNCVGQPQNGGNDVPIDDANATIR